MEAALALGVVFAVIAVVTLAIISFSSRGMDYDRRWWVENKKFIKKYGNR